MRLQFYSDTVDGEYAPVLIFADAEGGEGIQFDANFDVGKLKLPKFGHNCFPL